MDRAKPDPAGFSSLHKNKKRAAHFGGPPVSLCRPVFFLVAQPLMAVLLVLQAHVQPDEFGLVLFLKMTVNRVSHHLAQFFDGLALREDGIPQRSRRVSPLGRVFNRKNDLLIGHDRQETSSFQEYTSTR
jgi:hypothetical protein